MTLPPFKESKSLSMGIELELQLVNTVDYDLTPAAKEVLKEVARVKHPGDIKPEITQSMIELSTSPHLTHASLVQELAEIRDVLVNAVHKLNVDICGGGTHPFQRWNERRIYETARFKVISELYGYLAKQFTVFGQHIHIGCENPNKALFLLHTLGRFVPHFIALSASSPFFQGVDTAFDSSRLNTIFMLPLSGSAPFLLEWDQFEQGYFNKLADLGIVKSMKDFYWDIRPKPEYGTIELRVCDTPLTIDRAAALAGYLQTLIGAALNKSFFEPAKEDYLVYNFNRFQACRFGLEGMIIDPKTKEQVTIQEDILTTLARIESQAIDLKADTACAEVKKIAQEGNDAKWLRDSFAQSGLMSSVVQEQIRLWRG